MSTIKCSNCHLVNFATAQFCKRCNLALSGQPPNRVHSETQIFTQPSDTHIRQTPPAAQKNQQNYYGQTGSQPNNQPNNHPNFQPNNRQNHYPPPPPSYDYTLPRFPHDSRPPEYKSSQNQQQYILREPALRRFGETVALHVNANLPEICVKCGKNLVYGDGVYVAQKYRWHHPAVYIALLSPLIYLILSLCLSHRATINVPLCGEHYEKRETAKNSMIFGGIGALFIFIAAIMFGWGGVAVLTFLGGLIGLICINEFGYKPLRVSKIENSYYHLTGASSEFTRNIPY